MTVANTDSSHTKYRPDIDGLRAIAVLAVVGFHAFPSVLRGGFIGVDIFFVISGYLISSILIASLNKDEFSIYAFYKKRILRIYPALITIVVACFIVGWFQLFSYEFADLGKNIAAGGAFVSNLLLWSETSYFDTDAETKPLLHLWSLAIEEQFYIIWPLFLLIIWRRHWKFAWVATPIALCSLGIGIYLTKANPTAAFYFPVSRFWELMAGGILAYNASRSYSSIENHKSLQALLGLGLIVAGLLLIKPISAFPGLWAVLPVLGSCLVISAGPSAWSNRKFLSHKWMVWVGIISYPLYLWHWPLLSFTQIFYGEVGDLARLLIVVLAATLAWLTYYFIEKPIRYGGNGRHLSVVLFFCMAVCGLAGYSTFKMGGFEGYGIRTPDKTEFVNYFENSRPNWHYFKKINRAESYRYDCDFYNLEQDRLNNRTIAPVETISTSCYSRDPSYTHSVFIWGDSYAQMLHSGLREVLPDDWQLLQVASSGCRPNVHVFGPSAKFYCDQSNWFAVKAIEKSQPDVVIVAQRSGHEPNRMNEISDVLLSLGVRKVIFSGPAPQWIPNLPRTIAARLWENTPKRTWIGVDRRVLASDKVLQKEFRSDALRRYASLTDKMCNSEGCIVYFGNDRKLGVSTFDQGHFGSDASKYIAANLLLPIIMENSGSQIEREGLRIKPSTGQAKPPATYAHEAITTHFVN